MAKFGDRYIDVVRYWPLGQDHVQWLIPEGQDPAAYADKRTRELCDKGLGAACYLAGKLADEPKPRPSSDNPMPPPTTPEGYKLNLRACSLGAAAGCWYAVLYIRDHKDVPDAAATQTRLVRWMERICERRAGACPKIAETLDLDSARYPPDLGSKMRSGGCARKDDLTWEEKPCK